MFKEADLIQISALQHYSYCPRQCALIHQEQEFAENVYTLRGDAVHERVDDPKLSYLAMGKRVEFALPLYSFQYGLAGKADVIEFFTEGAPYPVEYKQGNKREKLHDDIQVTAQALCLEEMLAVPVLKGSVYYASSKKRREVLINESLRAVTREVIQSVHNLLSSDRMPAAVNDKRCLNCSLHEICKPEILSAHSELNQLYSELFSLNSDEEA